MCFRCPGLHTAMPCAVFCTVHGLVFTVDWKSCLCNMKCSQRIPCPSFYLTHSSHSHTVRLFVCASVPPLCLAGFTPKAKQIYRLPLSWCSLTCMHVEVKPCSNACNTSQAGRVMWAICANSSFLPFGCLNNNRGWESLWTVACFSGCKRPEGCSNCDCYIV